MDHIAKDISDAQQQHLREEAYPYLGYLMAQWLEWHLLMREKMGLLTIPIQNYRFPALKKEDTELSEMEISLKYRHTPHWQEFDLGILVRHLSAAKPGAAISLIWLLRDFLNRGLLCSFYNWFDELFAPEFMESAKKRGDEEDAVFSLTVYRDRLSGGITFGALVLAHLCLLRYSGRANIDTSSAVLISHFEMKWVSKFRRVYVSSPQPYDASVRHGLNLNFMRTLGFGQRGVG